MFVFGSGAMNYAPVDVQIKELRCGLVVSVLDGQPRDSVLKSRTRQKFGSRLFLLHMSPLANSAMLSTLTARCQSEDETVKERTGRPPSYGEKLLRSRVLL